MNKCTLLIDGNWLMRSRMSVLTKGFNINNSDVIKSETAREFKDLLAKSINVMINKFPQIDNIVLVSDGGSWRKNVKKPECISKIVYKGNRKLEEELDWRVIYDSFNEFFDKCLTEGITCTNGMNIEGDDWIWYWSRFLNYNKTNCIIWSVDCDLKQLVQYNNGIFTAWYNDNAGLVAHEDLDSSKYDELDLFMDPTKHNVLFESIINKLKKVTYINPNDIIIDKIIFGDSGDNIKPVVQYTKSNRIYKITNKDWKEIKDKLNISDINDIKNNIDLIATSIYNINKNYQSRTIKDIAEMIAFNIKMVFLDKSVMPEKILEKMHQQQYKLFDIKYIKTNYKVLCPEENESEIINLFESIK